MILPFLTSLGALLFEFSVSQFLSLAVGSSAFGFPFVVGSFLLAMGIGAWLAERVPPERSRSWLVGAEVALALLCLATLPFLAWSTGALKDWVTAPGGCRSLLCSGMGVVLSLETFVVLGAVGLLVGLEIPLFIRILSLPLGRVLAADYAGAFAAGILFPLVLLPLAGLFGTLLVAGFCHLSVALALRGNAFRVPLAVTAVLFLGAVVWVNPLERWLTGLLVGERTVTTYFRTRKQTVVVTEEGGDRRLYLDGYLQFSSAWNQEAYHRAMVIPAREALEKDRADVLVLGGGDGDAARVAREKHPGDRVLVVDHDCELLDRMKVEGLCADAFWFLRQRESVESWDLVLVDFPHGVGEAAGIRVESLEFFLDLRRVLRPGGIAVLQHEEIGSPSHACVEETLERAGFAVSRAAVGPGGEVMILGRKGSRGTVDFSPGSAQTFLRPNCFALRRWGGVWIGG